MSEIKGTDEINYMYDYLTIYWTHYDDEKEINEGKCINKILSFEYGEKSFTFNDVIELAKQYGYTEDDVLHVNADSAMSGKVYCYGNYRDKWYEYGTTRGYV